MRLTRSILDAPLQLSSISILIVLLASKATCMAAGDPHYRTFDGKRYDFMGDCEYTLAKDTGNTFEITTKNRRCRRRYTCTVSFSVAVNGLKIRVDKGASPKVNGIVVSLPYRSQGETTE